MSDRLVATLLRVALRRWPAELRSDMAREWRAELEALRQDGEIGRARRTYRRIRFAASLAAARPPAAPAGAERVRWRETGWGSSLSHALLVVLAPLLASVGISRVRAMASLLLHATGLVARSSSGPPTLTVTGAAVMAASLAGTVLAVAAAGSWLARDAPTLAVGGGRLAASGGWLAAVVVAVEVGAGVILAQYVTDAFAGLAWRVADVVLVGAGAATITILLPPAIAVVARLRAHRQRHARPLATTAAVTSVLVIADLAVAVVSLPSTVHAGLWQAPLLLPVIAMLDPAAGLTVALHGHIFEADMLRDLPMVLLASTALGLGYAVRAARATPQEAPPAAQPIEVQPPQPISGLRPLGLACWLVGLITWALALTTLSPLLERRAERAWSEEAEQYLMWSLDLRVGALLLASLGLFVVVCPRGPALLAPVAGFAVLVRADAVAAGAHLSGPRGAVLAVLVGVGVAAAVWGLTVGLERRRPRAAAAHRRPRPTLRLTQHQVLAGAAVMGVYAVPALFVRGGWHPPAYAPLPVGLPVGTAVVAGLLAALAAACAMTARARPPRRRTATVLTAAIGLATATLVAMARAYDPVLVAVPLFGPALVIVTVGAIRGFGSRLRAWLGWLAAGLVGTALALVLLIVAYTMPPVFFDARLVDAGGGDGYSVLPGTAIIAMIVATVVAARLRRQPPSRGGQARPEPAVPDPPASSHEIMTI